MLLKAFNGLFLAAFLLSVAVQYNDPDASVWIALYLGAAGMCLTWYAGRLPRWLPGALLVLCLGWIAFLLPSIIGRVSPAEVVESLAMQSRAVEEAREIGGLLLVGFWAAILCAFPRRRLT